MPAENFSFTPSLLAQAMSYAQYRQLIDHLLAEGKTTGPKQSEAMLAYTKQNVQRMKRLDKTTVIVPELVQVLQSLEVDWLWVIITEAWCGDAAQNIPPIEHMATLNAGIGTCYLLRDEHPQVMEAYLTNGARSIPKLICLNANTLAEVGTWGPRPAVLQEAVKAYKQNPTKPYAEFSEEMHKWYAQNKTAELQAEFLEQLPTWELIESVKKVDWNE